MKFLRKSPGTRISLLLIKRPNTDFYEFCLKNGKADFYTIFRPLFYLILIDFHFVSVIFQSQKSNPVYSWAYVNVLFF